MGKLIALSGYDGVGKSTQVRLLKEYLEDKGKKVKVTEQMFGYYLLKPIIKYLRRSTKSPEGGPVARNHSLLPRLWSLPAFVDIWLMYILSIVPQKYNYDYIIADRYYTDIWANLLYYGYIPKAVYYPSLRLLPVPDISITLLADPKVVLKREKEFPSKYYLEQSKIYKDLANNTKTKVIMAGRNQKSVFKDIISTLFD